MSDVISVPYQEAVDNYERVFVDDNKRFIDILNFVRFAMSQRDFVQTEFIHFKLYPKDRNIIVEEDLRRLNEILEFNPTSEVRTFLRRNDYLIDLIRIALDKVSEFFSAEKFRLSVVNDPEIADSNILVLEILTERSPEVALDLLGQFNKKWWFLNSSTAKQKLLIKEEFV